MKPVKKKEVKKATVTKKKEYKETPQPKREFKKDIPLLDPDAKFSLCLSRKEIIDLAKAVKEPRLKEYLTTVSEMPAA